MREPQRIVTPSRRAMEALKWPLELQLWAEAVSRALNGGVEGDDLVLGLQTGAKSFTAVNATAVTATAVSATQATVASKPLHIFAAKLNSAGSAIEDRDALPLSMRIRDAATEGLVLTGSDAGSDATISISAHTRTLDGATVNYASGSVTGLAYSTGYHVYVDDPAGDGSGTYGATTTFADVSNSPTRLYLGGVTTPAASDPPTGGTLNGGGGTFMALV